MLKNSEQHDAYMATSVRKGAGQQPWVMESVMTPAIVRRVIGITVIALDRSHSQSQSQSRSQSVPQAAKARGVEIINATHPATTGIVTTMTGIVIVRPAAALVGSAMGDVTVRAITTAAIGMVETAKHPLRKHRHHHALP